MLVRSINARRSSSSGVLFVGMAEPIEIQRYQVFNPYIGGMKMSVDSARKLRAWGQSLETALGISVMLGDDRGLMLKTKAGCLIGIAPVPGLPALVWTGVIGTADETTSEQTLCGLLALNLTYSLSGMGFVGLDANSRQIRFRLMWMPRDDGWTDEAFGALFVSFCKHVDALAQAFAAEEIEKLVAMAFSEASDFDAGPAPTLKA